MDGVRRSRLSCRNVELKKKRVKNTFDWSPVWARLAELGSYPELWRSDQDRSLAWIARQLQSQPGVLVADEVGLGKTRLAIALAVCVAACGGRVAILIPPGLTFQWRDEELPAFLAQLAGLNLDWVPADIQSKVLRTYPDLFDAGKRLPQYPLSSHAPFVFLSHRFGLPYRLASVKDDELWGLPFALKLKLVGDGRRARGAGALVLSEGQSLAVDWLAARLPQRLRTQVTDGALSKVSTAMFDDPEATSLFQALIGELVGDFDLIVIDEAHKSRAGADTSTPTDVKKEKRAATILQSRLTHCLEQIILRQGSASRQAKRLAMTATPMEMDAEQWGAIFKRLGLEHAETTRLKKAVADFSDTVKALLVGSTDEVTRLAAAGAAFQAGLRPIVTRRIWRDHPEVKRFAPHSARIDAAHPHRRTVPSTVALANLSDDERIQLACAEGLAAAARGIATRSVAKNAGARHAQALPLISEAVMDASPVPQEDTKQDETSSAAERAKRQRQAYWQDALTSLSQGMGPVAAEPRWSLQWHPKVRHALLLIEGLASQGKKVLVFAEFLDPMQALDRALNIRHYLRQVREGTPLPLPAGLKADDPDLLRWLASPELGFTADQIASFQADSAALATRYSNDRAALREACRHAAHDFFKHLHPAPAAIRAASMDTLVTWLVQQLCANDRYALAAAKEDRSQIGDIVDKLLNTLRDPDPAGKSAADDAAAGVPFNWEVVIREQERDLEKDQNGHYVFRMSPFSQRLYGDIKPSTRRVRQSAFNNEQLNPRVLIGQSAVASEGLNLHRACRSVVLFHLDWNPGRIEQQIGRVDRQDSAWMKTFIEWEKQGAEGEAPYIDVHTIALEGTYDAYRTEVVNERAKVLRSQLFGEILPPEQLLSLPEEVRTVIGAIDIDFRP